jgi:predicted O-methyltransferase YrrM
LTAPMLPADLVRVPGERARRLESALRLRRSGLGRRARHDLDRVEAFREQLLADDREIEVIEYGAGHKTERRTPEEMAAGRVTHGIVHEICKRASSRPAKALLLYALVREFAPRRALELGTCLGISAAYQAMAIRHAGEGGQLTTLEGAPAMAEIARETFAAAGLDNVDVRVGRFVDTMPVVLAEGPVGYAFVDGHHDGQATLDYFEQILPHAPDALLVFDDIRWNDRMEAAWHRIAADDRIELAVDLQGYGLVLTR